MDSEVNRQESEERFERSVRDVELRLKAIVDAAVDGIITINTSGTVLSMNEAASSLFGYANNEVIGKNVSLLMPNSHASKHDGYIKRYQKTREAKIIGIGRKVEGLRKDGQTFPFRLSVSEVVLGAGVLFTGIIHDLSAQVEAEQKLLKLNAELEEKVYNRTAQLEQAIADLQSSNLLLSSEVEKRKLVEEELVSLLGKERKLNALKTRFVSMASHEFRTPLGGILSSAQLIAKYTNTADEEKRAKHVNRIKAAVAELTDTLDDFLDFDKLQNEKVQVQKTTFDLLDLLEACKADTLIMLKSKQRLRIDSPRPIRLHADRTALRHIMLNLLSNAIKYSEEGTLVQVVVSQNTDWLEIAVIDEGIGIPEIEQEHLFERFFRASNASVHRGTGLGLNIVKRYLAILEGRIDFTSKIGAGSTFTILLPFTNLAPNE